VPKTRTSVIGVAVSEAHLVKRPGFGRSGTRAYSMSGPLRTVSGPRRVAWDLNNFDRGDVIEELYYVSRGGRQPPELDDIRAAFYPGVDSKPIEEGFRVAEQLKTVDFGGQIQSASAIAAWQTRMREAMTKLENVRVDGISEYNKEGLFIAPEAPFAFDDYVLRIEVSAFSGDPGTAARQQLALQEIVDEGATRQLEVVVQSIGA